jgi:hypothetical protein
MLGHILTTLLDAYSNIEAVIFQGISLNASAFNELQINPMFNYLD